MHGYLRHLANFARVVEAGSLKSASDVLGVAPSGLSDSVKILEGRFGTALLIRHKSGVTPTREGERVYAAAAGIVDLLNEALGAGETEELSGSCRLSVPTEVAGTCLGAVIRYLGDAHPKLNVRVFAEDDFVDHSRFARDYFLRVAPKFDRMTDLRTVWSGKAHAILVASTALVSDDEIQDPEAIARYPALVGTDRKPPFQFPMNAPKGRITFDRAISVSHPATQLSLAAQGLGVTGCIDICAATQIEAGVLRRVLPERFSIPLEVRLLTPHRRKTRHDDAMVAAMAHLPVAG